MNECTFIGYVADRPELKTTASGLEVCNFDLAVPREKKGSDGKLVYDYISIEAWRERAEFASRYFDAGTRIWVRTTLRTDSWKAQDGTNRRKFTFVLDKAEFCERKQSDGQPSQGSQGRQSAQGSRGEQTPGDSRNAYDAARTSSQGAPNYEPLDEDEELPF